MKDWFVCPAGPSHKWDHRSMDVGGIAGSETCVIEISRRLAKRGHDVTVFANCPEDVTDDGPVKWRHFEEFRTDPKVRDEPGNWWICRHPPLLDGFQGKRDDQRLILRCDDLHYGPMGTPNALTPSRHAKLDHILFMSPQQRDFWKKADRGSTIGMYPFIDLHKTSTIGCGIDSARIAAMPKVERDPYRLIWPSCPNRGLEHAITILQEARKTEPRLHLHVYYGFEGMDAAANGDENHPDAQKKKLIMSLDHTNVTFHGRVNKETLWDAYLRSNIWCYPNSFPECGVVSAQEAQACGAIPITRPYFGLIEMVKNGVMIQGDPELPQIRQRYVDSLLEILGIHAAGKRFEVENPRSLTHEHGRSKMMAWARDHYDWERVIDHHEKITECDSPLMLEHYGGNETLTYPFARAPLYI